MVNFWQNDAKALDFRVHHFQTYPKFLKPFWIRTMHNLLLDAKVGCPKCSPLVSSTWYQGLQCGVAAIWQVLIYLNLGFSQKSTSYTVIPCITMLYHVIPWFRPWNPMVVPRGSYFKTPSRWGSCSRDRSGLDLRSTPGEVDDSQIPKIMEDIRGDPKRCWIDRNGEFSDIYIYMYFFPETLAPWLTLMYIDRSCSSERGVHDYEIQLEYSIFIWSVWSTTNHIWSPMKWICPAHQDHTCIFLMHIWHPLWYFRPDFLTCLIMKNGIGALIFCKRTDMLQKKWKTCFLKKKHNISESVLKHVI